MKRILLLVILKLVRSKSITELAELTYVNIWPKHDNYTKNNIRNIEVALLVAYAQGVEYEIKRRERMAM